MSGSTYPITRLEEIASPDDGAIAIGPFGSAMKASLYTSSGVAVIRGNNIGKGRQLVGEYVYVSPDTAARLKRSLLKRGDIFLPHRGAIGEVGIVHHDAPSECLMSTSLMRLRVDKTRTVPEYVFWALKSAQGRHEILTYASTVGTPGIGQPLTSLRAMRIPLPPLPEQRRIASLLGALDDRIELNRRMNATLEEMARGLFRSWFVDFDPVHARAAGEAPAHMPPETAALFPDSFAEDGLPVGWRMGAASDVVVMNPKEKLKKGAVAPYLDMKALPLNSARADAPIQREFTSGTKFRNGDTLLARITPCLENGKTALVDGLPDGVVGWGSTEFIVMRGAPGVSAGFVYCLSRDPDFRERAEKSMVGSSGRQRVQQESLAAFEVALAPQSVLSAFAARTDPLFAKLTANGRQMDTLAELRDALLPRLMSGELRVAEAEDMTEALL